jgi:predicted RNA-binding Zn ribbon-like protein
MDDEEKGRLGEKSSAGNLSLLGGYLCLDFVNTVDWRLGERPRDWLATYGDLIAWSRHAGILSASGAGRLLRESERSPDAADAALRSALALREAVYRIFSSIAAARGPRTADIAVLNRALSISLPHRRLAPRTGGFEWDWTRRGETLERPMWDIAQSAADLLTSGQLHRVRQCGDERCGWLFFDRSKNRSRRWCSMDDCGNRAKARRHYRRSRASDTRGG